MITKHCLITIIKGKGCFSLKLCSIRRGERNGPLVIFIIEALFETIKRRLFSVKQGYFQSLTLIRYHLGYIFRQLIY